jgi:hypothetical protein
MVAIVPVLVALVGLVLYLVPMTNPKPTEIGRILFWTGVLVTLLSLAGHSVKRQAVLAVVLGRRGHVLTAGSRIDAMHRGQSIGVFIGTRLPATAPVGLAMAS